MRQSRDLTIFYKSYQSWLDNGAPQDSPYSRDIGLCDNIRFCLSLPYYVRKEVRNEIEDQFDGITYPFGFDNYVKDNRDCAQHENELRLQWVKDHLTSEYTGGTNEGV